MMRVLVTGAGGFIGSHLTEKLVNKGYEVKALAYYNSLGTAEWLDHLPEGTKSKIEIVWGDIRDLSFVGRVMEGCEGVFHLAALIGIPYSYVNPESYIDTNVKGTMNVMEAARDLGIKKIVHTSTSEVYGSARFVPITEEHPLQGQSPYSASKIGADQMAYSYACSFDLPVVIVRPFNTFGPRQSLRAVIPTVITQLLRGDGLIKIGSLEPTRDFSHVSDTVSGFISAFESDNPEIIGDVINIGSNFEISIGDMIGLLGKITGKEPYFEEQAARVRPENSEVTRLYCANLKAKEMLGWSPAYGGLEGFEKALSETVEWFSNPENLKLYSAADRYVI